MTPRRRLAYDCRSQGVGIGTRAAHVLARLPARSAERGRDNVIRRGLVRRPERQGSLDASARLNRPSMQCSRHVRDAGGCVRHGKDRVRWKDRRRLAHVGAVVASSRHTSRGCAQHRAGRPRRCGIRTARLLRVRHRHSRDRRCGGRGRPAGELPHDGAVLADSCLSPHRPESPPQWHGPRRRPGDRLSRVLGPTPGRTASSPRSSARTGTPPMPWGSGI